MQLRMALIDLVELEDYTISVAAKELGIKLSTAKLIMTRYRKTGTVFRRKRERTEQREGNKARKERIEAKPSR